MIGKIMPHKSAFGPTALYALKGRQRDNPERVEWVAMRNLEGVSVEAAHHVMQATASLSPRVKVPRGHLIVSWAHGDHVTPEQMAAIMDQTMADLGLSEHQAMYVAHNDTDHKHVHAIYNRVHPETGKAASDSYERLTLRRSLMRQEQAHGLKQTPYMSRGHHEVPVFSEIEMASREDRDSRLRFSKKRSDQLREELAFTFKTANSWQSLSDMLERRGYQLTKAGAGVRVVRHLHYAKLSDVLPPKLNAKKLTQRWGKFADFWYPQEKQKLHAQKRKQRQLEQRQKQRQKQKLGL